MKKFILYLLYYLKKIKYKENIKNGKVIIYNHNKEREMKFDTFFNEWLVIQNNYEIIPLGFIDDMRKAYEKQKPFVLLRTKDEKLALKELLK